MSSVSKEEKPRAYMGCVAYKGLHGILSSEVNYPPFVWVKARTVTEDVGPSKHIMVDKEQFLKWNPDVIFVDVLGLGVLLQDRKLHPEYYGALKAFQDSRVYVLYPFNSYGVNVDNAVVNAYAIGKILYPDRFQRCGRGTQGE